MKVIIACGGTGGHLFPGLAVAQKLRTRGHEVMLLISEKQIDTQASQSHPEFRFEKLPSVGMPSPLSPAFIRFLRRMWESLSRCRDIYKRFEPSAVLGMGGFTSTAPIVAGSMRKIPTLIHESNVIPGRANRFNARFASRLLLGFEQASEAFPGKNISVTGTPIRETLGARMPREEALSAFKLDATRKTLLVMGGSQGAAGVNQLLFRAAPLLREGGIQIIHLTGDRDDRLAAANYLREGIPAYVAAFHNRMEEAYSAADLIVSRAGASSLSEICTFELPSILIPYPYATDNHQEANARVVIDANAGFMLLESEAVGDKLATIIVGLMKDDERRREMGQRAKALAGTDAAEAVADALEQEIQ